MKRYKIMIATGAALIGTALGTTAVVALATPMRHGARPFGVSAAEATQACRVAVEAEARGRVAAAPHVTGASSVVSGVDVGTPVWVQPRWTLNATMHFTILSMLGAVPLDVYVTCRAVRGPDGRPLVLVGNAP